jgi:hypothetical protein
MEANLNDRTMSSATVRGHTHRLTTLSTHLSFRWTTFKSNYQTYLEPCMRSKKDFHFFIETVENLFDPALGIPAQYDFVTGV